MRVTGNEKKKPGGRVIAVCGAGGKSTYIRREAKKYADAGLKTAVTTTTHILNDEDFGRKCGNEELISLAGRTDPENPAKLCYPGDEEFERICLENDIVLVEADGSKHLPVKIPAEHEPVIPANADVAVVICGAHAVGKRLSEVCHRFELLKSGTGVYSSLRAAFSERFGDPDTAEVSREMLYFLAEECYMKPFKRLFPEKETAYYLSFFGEPSFRENQEEPVKANLILLASGFGRRFGGNKLLCEYKGKKLYRHMLDSLAEAAEILEKRFSYAKGKKADCRFTVTVVSRYDEILEAGENAGRLVKSVYNPLYADGISGSIKTGTQVSENEGCDYEAFFVADTPKLEAREIADFISDFLSSGKELGAVCAEGKLRNPAVISARYFSEVKKLEGDKGFIGIIREHESEAFVRYTDEGILKDIDEPEDMYL